MGESSFHHHHLLLLLPHSHPQSNPSPSMVMDIASSDSLIRLGMLEDSGFGSLPSRAMRSLSPPSYVRDPSNLPFCSTSKVAEFVAVSPICLGVPSICSFLRSVSLRGSISLMFLISCVYLYCTDNSILVSPMVVCVLSADRM